MNLLFAAFLTQKASSTELQMTRGTKQHQPRKEIRMTFRDRFMKHEAEFDEIFDLTEEWGLSDDLRTLREYLGLTAEEEDVWISESDEALEELLQKERGS